VSREHLAAPGHIAGRAARGRGRRRRALARSPGVSLVRRGVGKPEANAQLCDKYLDEVGVLTHKGGPRSAAVCADVMHARVQSLRAVLGLDPASTARLLASLPPWQEVRTCSTACGSRTRSAWPRTTARQPIPARRAVQLSSRGSLVNDPPRLATAAPRSSPCRTIPRAFSPTDRRQPHPVRPRPPCHRSTLDVPPASTGRGGPPVATSARAWVTGATR
jgi:hypothetical protein